jgi:fermentation-respiration switch protein FrsA (DUF1100 family)
LQSGVDTLPHAAKVLVRPRAGSYLHAGGAGSGFRKCGFQNRRWSDSDRLVHPGPRVAVDRLDSINFFYDIGLNCFIFDYRGYGNSQGKPTEEGTYLDAAAAYKWLTEEKRIPPADIIIFGRSLGGCIAAQLASKVQPGALAIESTFTSYVDMGRKLYPYLPVRWFAAYSYRTIDYIKEIRCPVMIIHSRNDEVVPFEFALELHEAANKPKQFVEIIGSHNDGFIVSCEIYQNAWTTWLKSLQEYLSQTDRQHAS